MINTHTHTQMETMSLFAIEQVINSGTYRPEITVRKENRNKKLEEMEKHQ